MALLIAAMNSRSATAKTRPAHLSLEDHQLMAKDHQPDFGVHLLVGKSR